MNTKIELGQTKEISFSAGKDNYTRKAKVSSIDYFDEKENFVKMVSENQMNEYEYYDNGKKKKEEVYYEGKFSWRYEYDEFENQVKFTDKDGTVEETVIEKYFVGGKPALARCGDRTITYEYDDNGNEVKMVTSYADGHESVRTKEYDSHGRMILLKNGDKERFCAYDSRGRKIFDGTNRGESNYIVYSDDESFKIVRYSNAEEDFEYILETVTENGKKVMDIMYDVIK